VYNSIGHHGNASGTGGRPRWTRRCRTWVGWVGEQVLWGGWVAIVRRRVGSEFDGCSRVVVMTVVDGSTAAAVVGVGGGGGKL